MATLTLDHLCKVYPSKAKRAGPPPRAVDDVSMQIRDGEIVGLLGSSGCGKTSTLRMVAGFESVTAGQIRIGDLLVNDLAPADRNVAMAFEGYALYPPLKVSDNIGFSLRRRGRPRAEVDRQVHVVAELLEITDILDQYPPLLSGGQQQRVSLARALARPADIYLLDEPMSQLEPQLRAVLRARLKDYLIGHKMTSVFVTHDQTEAMALADRIAVMSEGVLQQFGSPLDLKERPANLFVASFIGEPPMTLIDARLEAGPRATVTGADSGGTAFAVDLAGLPTTDANDIRIGLRPHKLLVEGVAPLPADLAGRIDATVVSSAWLGDQCHVNVAAGGINLLVVTDRRLTVGAGSPIRIAVPRAAVHVFDRASGKARWHGSSPNS